MTKLSILCLCLGSLFATGASQATPLLLATGSLSGNQGDLATQTAGPLENGVAGNLLGGIGSGLAWAGGTTFLATPDRGPNATPYNPLVDDTTSYIARFQSLNLQLTAGGGALPFSATPTLTGTTLLSSSAPLVYGTGALGTGAVGNVNYTLGSGVPTLNATNNTNYFTGRSDNFDPKKTSGNDANARLDPESIRVSADGKSVFISDEYGPYVYQFDRATGVRTRSFALPANLDVSKLSAMGDTEISQNKVGRVANKGMEGLAITPDGKTLVGIMQAPLEQDKKNNLRIVTIDIATGATHEYAYLLTTGSGVSDIVAMNDHQFIVDERDGKGLGDGSTAAVKQLFKIDIAGAQDVTSMSGDLSAKAVPKTLLLDVVAQLGAHGVAADQVPAKLEGLAFGTDVTFDGVLEHTLFLTNDNDFVPGVAGDNKFFVFGFSDADLAAVGASFSPQVISVPEPTNLALMLGGLAGLGLTLRRRAGRT